MTEAQTDGMEKAAEQVLVAALDNEAIHAYTAPDVRRLAALLADGMARRALLDALDASPRKSVSFWQYRTYEAERRAERAERERDAERRSRGAIETLLIRAVKRCKEAERERDEAVSRAKNAQTQRDAAYHREEDLRHKLDVARRDNDRLRERSGRAEAALERIANNGCGIPGHAVAVGCGSDYEAAATLAALSADADAGLGGFHHDFGCTHDPCECSGEPSRAEGDERRVTLDEIDQQRERGWPDFHPEDYCHRCGAPNPSWLVDSDRFNAAMGDAGSHRWQGIVCVGCFVRLHEAATGLTCTWKLVPETPFRHIEGDGR